MLFNKSLKTLLIHPGTQYSYKLAEQLSRKKYLLFFYTGLAIAKKSLSYKIWQLLPDSFRRKTANRIINNIKPSELKLIPFFELKALREVRQMKNNDDIFFERNANFQKRISRSIISRADVVIGFDTSSWIISEIAAKQSKPFFLDISIAHSSTKEAVYAKISSLYPDWQFNIDFKQDKFLEIEKKEHMQATALVVASSFSKKTLIENGIDARKIFVNAYGVDLSRFKYSERPPRSVIKFLFTGIVDARKGIPFLLKVWQKFKDKNVSLTLLGPVTKPVRDLISQYGFENVSVFGKVPHTDLPEIMANHDIFIFPSFFEGFGLVILEAMASGMPVITTTATAGPDLITEAKDGFIIEPGDEELLEKHFNYVLENPERIKEMGKMASIKAQEYSWNSYGDRWINIIDKVTKIR